MRDRIEDDSARPTTFSPRRRRIGEVLIAEGTIPPEQLQSALEGHKRTARGSERLGEAIVRLGFASEEDIARALAVADLGIPR